MESIAQVVGRRTRDQEVPGSSPGTGLNFKVAVKHKPKSSICKSGAVFNDQQSNCKSGEQFRLDQDYKPTPIHL